MLFLQIIRVKESISRDQDQQGFYSTRVYVATHAASIIAATTSTDSSSYRKQIEFVFFFCDSYVESCEGTTSKYVVHAAITTCDQNLIESTCAITCIILNKFKVKSLYSLGVTIHFRAAPRSILAQLSCHDCLIVSLLATYFQLALHSIYPLQRKPSITPLATQLLHVSRTRSYSLLNRAIFFFREYQEQHRDPSRTTGAIMQCKQTATAAAHLHLHALGCGLVLS